MKRKTVTETVEEPNEEPGEETVQQWVPKDDIEAIEEWERIREAFGDNEGKVIIKRRNAKGQLSMIDTLAVTDFSPERIMQDWGGGRYLATAYKGGVKLGQMSIDVDESVPRRTPTRDPEQPATLTPIHRANGSEDPRVAALERSLESTNDLLKTLITSMLTKGQNGGETSTLKTAMEIAEMINARVPTQERPSFADLKDIFLAGIEAKQAAEGGGDEEGYGPVLRAFSGPIAKVLDQALSRDQQGMAGAVPVAPPRQPQQTATAQPSPQLPPGQAWLIHLQPHLQTLMAWAKAGKDPNLYAEVILDNIEPGAQMEIAQAAKDPEFVSKTVGALPMFAPYSAWVTAILTNIQQLVSGPPEGDGGNEGAGDGVT